MFTIKWILVDELGEYRWTENSKTNPRNYKHMYEVKVACKTPKDSLAIITIRQRFDCASVWLKANLVKGQDWTFSKEEYKIKEGDWFCCMPKAVWFNEKEHAIAFRFALGMDDE